MARAHELGQGRLVRGIPNGRPQKVLRIDATGIDPTLIGRLLVGSYITGQDQVFVTARGGLTAAQRAEVRHVVGRLIGMSVVNDSPDGVEVENFVDPGKHELPRLLRRVVEIVRDELRICHAAVAGGPAGRLDRVAALEEEVDQLYLLMARQLLLSSDDARVARDINVESHHYQFGYRLAAKVLEMIGDLVEAIGLDLVDHLDGIRSLPGSLVGQLGRRIERLEELLARTMSAFSVLSVAEANAVLNEIAEAVAADSTLAQLIARRVSDQRVSAAAHRIIGNLAMALEMLVIVNEVTINRSVEPETVALTNQRLVSSWAHGGDPVPRPAHGE